MNGKMKAANLLAETIYGFMELIDRSRNDSIGFHLDRDKVYQLSLFAKEFKFRATADELKRINRFSWNEAYTYWLAEDLGKGLEVINEYVERNCGDLFIFTARLHTMKSLSLLLREEGSRRQ